MTIPEYFQAWAEANYNPKYVDAVVADLIACASSGEGTPYDKKCVNRLISAREQNKDPKQIGFFGD